MTDFQRPPNLTNTLRAVNRQVQAHEAFNRGVGQVLSFDGPFSVRTDSAAYQIPAYTWSLVKGKISTFLKPVIEIYAQGLGSTNGAGKYAYMSVYIDDTPIYADTLLQWGTSSAAVTNERRRTIPGSAQGTPSRLGGFMILQLNTSQFPSSDVHDIEITLEGVGTSANCTISDIQIVTRVL